VRDALTLINYLVIQCYCLASRLTSSQQPSSPHQKIMGGFTPTSTSHTRRPTPQQVHCRSASARGGGGRHYPLTLDTTLCAPCRPPRRTSRKHSRLEHACADRAFLFPHLNWSCWPLSQTMINESNGLVITYEY